MSSRTGRAPVHRTLALAAIAVLALGACSTSGGLGPVPTPPVTPSAPPSTDGPDLTPEPSGSPAVTPTPTAVPGTPSPTTGPTATPAPSAVETIIVRTYGILPGDPGVEGLVPTLQVVPATPAVARAAMEQLLAGNLANGVASAIPAGTRLLGLTIRDGVAIVDLSATFESGGGSASSFYRLGQVVYTLTQFSTVDAVLFQVEGRTVTTFGPEGIVLDGPQTRADFEDQLPAVFVDRPAFEAAIGNPARVTGTSNVFEATSMITILDGSGRTLAETFVTATCGTGCRGTFEATVPYAVSRAQWGTLRVWVASARDGSPENVRDYPVWLTPAG